MICFIIVQDCILYIYLNSASIQNLSNMFYGCSLLGMVEFGGNFVLDGSGYNVTNMFYGCNNLSYIRCSYLVKNFIQNHYIEMGIAKGYIGWNSV